MPPATACRQRLLFFLVALAVMGRAASSSAQEGTPSPLWPVLGVAVAGGGAALVYHQARQARTGDRTCLRLHGGCFWLGLAGSALEQVGGAAVAYWGWRLGERAFARDPTEDHRTMRNVGLVMGGAAVLAIFVGATYGAFAPFGCTQSAGTEPLDYRCIGRAQYRAQLVALSAVPVLLVAAPLLTYALGYDAARRVAGDRRALQWRLAPAVSVAGASVTLSGRF
jgi:hypothetical protein